MKRYVAVAMVVAFTSRRLWPVLVRMRRSPRLAVQRHARRTHHGGRACHLHGIQCLGCPATKTTTMSRKTTTTQTRRTTHPMSPGYRRRRRSRHPDILAVQTMHRSIHQRAGANDCSGASTLTGAGRAGTLATSFGVLGPAILGARRTTQQTMEQWMHHDLHSAHPISASPRTRASTAPAG